MKIIDRYIFKQVAFATIVGLLAFTVVWISPEILFKIIKKAIDGQISVVMAFKLFFLEMPEILGTLVPASLMLGSIWVFDQLSRDSELTIMRGIGVSFYRLVIPVIFLSFLGVILSFILYEYAIPYSNSTLKTLKDDIRRDYFVFVDKAANNKPKEILIIGDYKNKDSRSEKISNVKLLKFSDTIDSENPIIKSISIADTANWGKNSWTLNKVMEYEIAPDGVYRSINKFDSIKALSPESSMKAYNLLLFSTKKTDEMNLSKLKDYLKLLKSLDMKSEYNYILSKYYQRFAKPFSCILFALCGVVLGFGKPREKKFLGFTIGIALIFLYFITIPFIEMLTQIGLLEPAFAAWVPNLSVLIALIALVKHKQI